MKMLPICAALAISSFAMTDTAQARGCIKGAILGGVAGHYVGHHGFLGAVAGCAIGRHEANKHDRGYATSQKYRDEGLRN